MLRRRDVLKVLILSLLAPFRIGSEEVVGPKSNLISNKSTGFIRGKVYFQLTLKQVKHGG